MSKTPPGMMFYTLLSLRLAVWVLAGGWAILVTLVYLTSGPKEGTLAVQQAGRATDYLMGLAGPTVIALAADRFFAVLAGFIPSQPADDDPLPKRWS